MKVLYLCSERDQAKLKKGSEDETGILPKALFIETFFKKSCVGLFHKMKDH